MLVVGFGNSGGELAIDLHEHGAHPSLAVRSPVNVIPRELFGLPILSLAIPMSYLPARVADVLGKCEPGGEGTLRATVQVVIDVARGPAFEGQSYELPLFVAVTDADAIRDKCLCPERIVRPQRGHRPRRQPEDQHGASGQRPEDRRGLWHHRGLPTDARRDRRRPPRHAPSMTARSSPPHA